MTRCPRSQPGVTRIHSTYHRRQLFEPSMGVHATAHVCRSRLDLVGRLLLWQDVSCGRTSAAGYIGCGETSLARPRGSAADDRLIPEAAGSAAGRCAARWSPRDGRREMGRRNWRWVREARDRREGGGRWMRVGNRSGKWMVGDGGKETGDGARREIGDGDE